MDSFIFYGDYAKQIQDANLQQIIGSNQSILDGIQKAAIDECISYLVQKYDTSTAFQPITQYDPMLSYKAGQTVYLNAPAYNPLGTYLLGALTLQNGNIYISNQAITVAESFNSAHWTLLDVQYAIYYLPILYSFFDYKQFYAVDDQVYWNGNYYTAKMTSQILDHETIIQINIAGANEVINVFPDDSVKGVQYWGNPITTTISAPAFSSFVAGDNRDQKLLMVCIDIALFRVHARISPRNIPELRTMLYMGNQEDRETRGQRVLYPTYSALGWLQAAAIGQDITPNLPLLQPYKGSRIRYGGNQKLINSY